MHTQLDTDNSQLDRFKERWRKKVVKDPVTKMDIKWMNDVVLYQYTIQCGKLYFFSEEYGCMTRAAEEACRAIAKLHAMELLEIEGGKVRLNGAGLAILNKTYKLQENEN